MLERAKPRYQMPHSPRDLGTPVESTSIGTYATSETLRNKAMFRLQIDRLRDSADPTEKVSRTGMVGAGRISAGRIRVACDQRKTEVSCSMSMPSFSDRSW